MWAPCYWNYPHNWNAAVNLLNMTVTDNRFPFISSTSWKKFPLGERSDAEGTGCLETGLYSVTVSRNTILQEESRCEGDCIISSVWDKGSSQTAEAEGETRTPGMYTYYCRDSSLKGDTLADRRSPAGRTCSFAQEACKCMAALRACTIQSSVSERKRELGDKITHKECARLIKGCARMAVCPTLQTQEKKLEDYLTLTSMGTGGKLKKISFYWTAKILLTMWEELEGEIANPKV